VEAKENKRFILYPHQQAMSSQFTGGRASVHIAVALEDKCRNNECSPHPASSFLLAVIGKQTSYGMEYPLESVLGQLS